MMPDAEGYRRQRVLISKRIDLIVTFMFMVSHSYFYKTSMHSVG